MMKRVLQVARELSMNPDKARKLWRMPDPELAIMKRIHKYEQLVGGDRGGRSQDNQKAPGQFLKTEKGASSPEYELNELWMTDKGHGEQRDPQWKIRIQEARDSSWFLIVKSITGGKRLLAKKKKKQVGSY